MNNIQELSTKGVTTINGMHDRIMDVKNQLEQRLNLNEYTEHVRPLVLNYSMVLRICLLVGLSDKSPRRVDDLNDLNLGLSRTPYATTFFTKADIGSMFETLLKLRYHDVEADWKSSTLVSKVIGREILRGHDMLMREGAIDEWLTYMPLRGGRSTVAIPELNLHIGEYDNGMIAYLDINSKEVTNTQILVAGTTGSGKSNLLAVLINQIRSASSDTHYPVNFLLFDYKGEFSDPANESWLQKFDTDRTAILNPMEQPLPFTPFKDFSGRPINEVNLYATSLATALCSISPAKISANMDDRLSRAIINAYKDNAFHAVTFQEVLEHYIALLPEKKQDESDSITSVLNQLVRNNIFANEDKIKLTENCYIINLGPFQKEGIMAKAIVYFVISKLNSIYEQLPKQAMNDERVEIRHFTIIDEAHYMLGFENKPLQNLIAVGRNKGMSVILATQNMESFKSKYFDFYANAQYPLIMKQQQQNDNVLKDLFGVSGSSLQELKQVIGALQKGELITRDTTSQLLGLGGKHWQKIKVTHLI